MDNGRILVVDDEPATRDGLRDLLNDWGYNAITAEDGLAALQKISTFRPSLVISDLVMPEMDGIGLLRQLKQELSNTSVIVLSAYGTIDMVARAMREGAYDYLLKPVDIQRLQLLIQEVLKQKHVGVE